MERQQHRKHQTEVRDQTQACRDTGHTVEHDHVNTNKNETDRAGDQAGLERTAAERGADHVGAKRLDLDRKRTDPDDRRKRSRVIQRHIAAGDRRVAAGDRLSDSGRAVHGIVVNDRDNVLQGILCILCALPGGCLKLLAAGLVERQLNQIFDRTGLLLTGHGIGARDVRAVDHDTISRDDIRRLP